MANVAKNTVAYANKKKYSARFNKENYKCISVFIHKTRDADILEQLSRQPEAVSVYVKNLIRADIK